MSQLKFEALALLAGKVQMAAPPRPLHRQATLMEGRSISKVPAKNSRQRRTQAERTDETRSALIEAAIRVLHRSGYNSATTGAIADEAGVSRGSIIYHFATRAKLMSDIIAWVYEVEQREYDDLVTKGFVASKPENWPEVLWRTFSRPSGLAVLEILLASRSDPELADLVVPVQRLTEHQSLEFILKQIAADERQARAVLRCFVWATRGFALSSVLSQDSHETEDAVQIFRQMVEQSFSNNVIGRSVFTLGKPQKIQ